MSPTVIFLLIGAAVIGAVVFATAMMMKSVDRHGDDDQRSDKED